MSFVSCSALVVLVLAGVPAEEEENILLIDRPKEPSTEQRLEEIRAFITRVVATQEQLQLESGDSVFVEVEIPLSAKPGTVEGALSDVQSGRGASFAPWAEVEIRPGKKAIVRYAVRASQKVSSGKYKMKATIVLRDRQGGRTVGQLKVSHELEVLPVSSTKEAVEKNRKGYRHHQDHAEIAFKALGMLHDYLRLDRVDRPPPAKRVPEEHLETFNKFLSNRLRADIARQRLRAAAEIEDRELAWTAIRAIGSLSKKPSGPAARARAIDGVTTERALSFAEAALNDLQIDEAEGFLIKLRNGGRLLENELAQTLALLGVVYTVRGRDRLARKHYGMALCIYPELELLGKRPLLQDAFQEVKENPDCDREISIENIVAKRRDSDDGPVIDIEAFFGPDPLEVVSGGDVQIWSSGGKVAQANRIPATHDKYAKLSTSIKYTENLENFSGRLLVKVFLKDVSGVVVASQGDPDPLPIPIGVAEGSSTVSSFNVPWWVWAVAGGVVVVGAATAGIIVATDRETVRGIGPIEMTF